MRSYACELGCLKFSIWLVLAILIVFSLAGCAESKPDTLTVMTHDSFAVSEDVVKQFETKYGVSVVFLKSGDAGEALNRAILAKDNPQADVFYGVDNTFLARALEAEIFVPYAAPALEKIPEAFQLDPQNRALPVDYGDVCINYDKAYFTSRNLAIPATLDDLIKPEYEGLLVVENPATSSPGLSFLLATIAYYGEEGYLDFWQALRENGVMVVNDWNTAYYTQFSGSSGHGPQPLVISYASSPSAEVIFADQPLEEAPTASIVTAGSCFRQIEFVGILKGTQNERLARAFIDFMLSETFQEDMPLQMFVFPVNSDAGLPDAFLQFAQIALEPASLDPALISANREKWIEDWMEVVLR